MKKIMVKKQYAVRAVCILLAFGLLFSMFSSAFLVNANTSSGSDELVTDKRESDKEFTIVDFVEFTKNLSEKLMAKFKELRQIEKDKIEKEKLTEMTEQETQTNEVSTTTETPANNVQTAQTPTSNQNTPVTPAPSGINSEMLAYVNDLRSQLGLSTLSYDSEMQSVADVRAQEIATLWSHQRPNGQFPDSLSSRVQRENLAKCMNGYAASDAFNSWLNSSSHYSALVHPANTGMAVSFFVGSDGTVYWALEFC